MSSAGATTTSIADGQGHRHVDETRRDADRTRRRPRPRRRHRADAPPTRGRRSPRHARTSRGLCRLSSGRPTHRVRLHSCQRSVPAPESLIHVASRPLPSSCISGNAPAFTGVQGSIRGIARAVGAPWFGRVGDRSASGGTSMGTRSCSRSDDRTHPPIGRSRGERGRRHTARCRAPRGLMP